MKHESRIDKVERIAKWSSIGLLVFIIWLGVAWICLFAVGEVGPVRLPYNISLGARVVRFAVCSLFFGGLVWLMLPKREHGTR